MIKEDILSYLDLNFVTVFGYDKDCYKYYDPSIIKDYPNYNKLIRSHITKNIKTLIEKNESYYSDCDNDSSAFRRTLESNLTTEPEDVPEDFIKRIRSLGLRYAASNLTYFMPGSDALSDINILSDNIDTLIDSINISDPNVIDIIISISNYFSWKDSSRKAVSSALFDIKDIICRPKKYIPFYKTNPISFSYFCKTVIKENMVEVAEKWPDLLRSMYSNNNFSVSAASSAESIWAFFNFDEYSEKRLNAVKNLEYRKRAIVYSAVILSGNGTSKIARKARSDGSKFVSYSVVKSILDSKDMYPEKEWRMMVVQVCDSRHADVVKLLSDRLPKKYLAFLAGNKLANKPLIIKRMSE